MMPNSDTDYKKLFGELIKKQMLVLGPDITLAKVKNVIGLTVDVNGDVIKLEGDPQQMLQGLINQFVELSGMIVKKTMESILTSYPGMMAMATSGAFTGGIQASTSPNSTNTAQSASQGDAAQASVSSGNTSLQTSSDSAVISSSLATEPPQMSDVQPDIPATQSNSDKAQSGPQPFSSKEMEDLNKALEELSKAPLSTETSQTTQNQLNK